MYQFLFFIWGVFFCYIMIWYKRYDEIEYMFYNRDVLLMFMDYIVLIYEWIYLFVSILILGFNFFFGFYFKNYLYVYLVRKFLIYGMCGTYLNYSKLKKDILKGK